MKRSLLLGLSSMICAFGQAQTHEILFSDTYNDTKNNGVVTSTKVLFADDQNTGKALDFRGNLNNIVNWESVDVSIDSDFTASLWVNIDEINTKELQYILTSRHNSAGQEAGGMSIGVDKEGKVFVNLFEQKAVTVGNIKSTETVTTKAWHHIVVRKTGDNVELFIDNTLKVSSTLTGVPISNSFFTLGALYNPSNVLIRPLNGLVDDVQLFADNLSDTDISELYNGNSITTLSSHHLTFDNSQLVDENNTSNLSGLTPPPTFVKDRNDVNESALEFNNSQTFAQLQEADIVVDQDFAIQFWIKPTNFNATQYLLSNTTDNAGNSTGGIDIKLNSNGSVLADVYSAGGNLISELVSTATLSPNTWAKITLTRQGNDLMLLINQSLEVSTTINETIQNNTTWTIGTKLNSNALPSSSYKGVVDDIKMYSNALSLTDLLENQGFNHNITFDNGTFVDDLGTATLTPINSISLTEDRDNNSSAAVQGGIDQIVNVSDVNLSLNKDFTVSHWIYLNPNSTDIQYTFTSRHNTAGQEKGGLDMGINKNGTFIATFRNINTSRLSLVSDNSIPTSQWHQLVIQRKGQTIYMYLNNQLIKQGNLTGEPNSPNFYTIGAMWNPGNDIIRELNGKIDDIQIYQYALNPNELTNLYNDGVVTSTIDNQVESTNIVYPNPADNVLYVSLEYLELYNSLGELVLTSENSTSIDISNLPSGLYFVNQNGHKQSIIIR